MEEWQAQKAYEIGDYARAIDVYEKSLQNHPSDSRGNFNLGDSYYRQGNFSLAEKHFLETLNSSKKDMRGEALYNLGNTKYRQGQLQEAVDFYDKALQVNPAHENAKLNRDFVLKQLEKKKENQKKDQDQKPDPNPDQPENKQQEQQQQQAQQQPEQKDKPEQQQEPMQGKQDESASKTDPSDENKKADDNQYGLKPKEVDQMLESVGDDPKKSLQDIILRDAERKKIKSEGKNW